MAEDCCGYAIYEQAMRAYGRPEFARWLCETYPWGGVDMAAAHRQWVRQQRQ